MVVTFDIYMISWWSSPLWLLTFVKAWNFLIKQRDNCHFSLLFPVSFHATGKQQNISLDAVKTKLSIKFMVCDGCDELHSLTWVENVPGLLLSAIFRGIWASFGVKVRKRFYEWSEWNSRWVFFKINRVCMVVTFWQSHQSPQYN